MPRTYADDQATLPVVALPPRVQAQQPGSEFVEPHTVVRAPCCGRECRADMIVRLPAVLPGAAEGELAEHRPRAAAARYACDACRELLVLRGALTRAALAAALGAPATLIAQLAAKHGEPLPTALDAAVDAALDAAPPLGGTP